ncbi:unnamed protein product [Pleuronectes platessa]|uniref:Uncharacterized protein n=1 Tax=Pleuronectes platessa TaxID=8262 RepID=A0A9N7V2A1_PLEPL|nr:unnamed protein product [Pleuronectes platessa]
MEVQIDPPAESPGWTGFKERDDRLGGLNPGAPVMCFLLAPLHFDVRPCALGGQRGLGEALVTQGCVQAPGGGSAPFPESRTATCEEARGPPSRRLSPVDWGGRCQLSTQGRGPRGVWVGDEGSVGASH